MATETEDADMGSNLPVDLSDVKHARDTIGLGLSVPVTALIRPGITGLTRTDTVYTITSSGSSGTFTLLVNGVATSALAFDVAHGLIEDAITAAGVAGVSVSGSAVSGVITNAAADMTIAVGTNSTNGTVTVTKTSTYNAGAIVGVLPKGFFIAGRYISTPVEWDGTGVSIDVGTTDDLQAIVADYTPVADTAETDAVSLIDSYSGPNIGGMLVAEDVNLVVGVRYTVAPTVGESLIVVTPWMVG